MLEASLLGIELSLSMDRGDELAALDAFELGAEERPDSEPELRDDRPLSLGELLSELLLNGLLDFVDERLDGLRESDGPDEPMRELLRPELPGELFEDLSEEPREGD